MLYYLRCCDAVSRVDQLLQAALSPSGGLARDACWAQDSARCHGCATSPAGQGHGRWSSPLEEPRGALLVLGQHLSILARQTMHERIALAFRVGAVSAALTRAIRSVKPAGALVVARWRVAVGADDMGAGDHWPFHATGAPSVGREQACRQLCAVEPRANTRRPRWRYTLQSRGRLLLWTVMPGAFAYLRVLPRKAS